MVERPISGPNRVRDVFDDWAKRGRALGMEESHAPFVRPAFARLPLDVDSWYLDIGCGNGYTVRWAADIVTRGRAVGMDVSAEMLALALRLTGERANVEYHLADFPDEHPLPHGRFDVIFSMEVFYYLADLDAGLHEVRRLLAPGGTFACQVDFYAENVASHSWPEDVGLAMHLLSEREWADAFRRAGLEVEDQFRVRLPRDTAPEPWKAIEGSLVTVGRRGA